MRIAFSGTHFSGKSSLIEALSEEFPQYEVFDEPYWILSDLGHHFSDPPTIEEFQEQLECSINLIKQSSGNTLFDRSPIDFLGYALAIAEEHSEEFDHEKWVSQIEKPLSSLDLIVFLPIENPDRIPLPYSEDKHLRLLVDEKLKELILEDPYKIMNTEILEVTGTLNQRIKKIKQRISNL